jgi:hypothetical protein
MAREVQITSWTRQPAPDAKTFAVSAIGKD